jgi:small subunit ribosomal protein S6
MANTAPDKVSGYETTFISRPELSDDGLKALQDRLAQVIASFQGEVVLTEDWGKRKLAYPIQKESRGQYTYFVYTGKGDVVHELERNLRLHDHVLRFLTVNLEKEFDSAQFRKQRADYHAAAKRREEEREARREERSAERRSYDERRDIDEVEELTMGASEADEE